MIKDLFSHKLHSSGDTWPNKLSELASIFGEFDGSIYVREELEQRLQKISPRTSSFSDSSGRADISKFRDEISAYPSYLGLYYLESYKENWIIRLSESTRRFLLREDPDVASFLRIQLSIFQYPNGMGAAYSSGFRIQANARDRTLSHVRKSIHLSPLRLISLALKADAHLRDCEQHKASISFSEVYALANSAKVNRVTLPNLEYVRSELTAVRKGKISPPSKFERRFHILKHTDLFKVEQGRITLREHFSEEDRVLLDSQHEAICSIDCQFEGFDDCTTGDDLAEVIRRGDWGRYFDGVHVIPSNILNTLQTENIEDLPTTFRRTRKNGLLYTGIRVEKRSYQVYPFRNRRSTNAQTRRVNRRVEQVDPEITRIKRQRRNLAHRELVDKMADWLRTLNASPKENEHIDLCAHIPNDGFFIFEMKSGGENLLEQIRKGISQLYEYRYRYRDLIHDEEVTLCLVLPENPNSIPWVTDYLCVDRGISICWFDSQGPLKWPQSCAGSMRVLVPQTAD